MQLQAHFFGLALGNGELEAKRPSAPENWPTIMERAVEGGPPSF